MDSMFQTLLVAAAVVCAAGWLLRRALAKDKTIACANCALSRRVRDSRRDDARSD